MPGATQPPSGGATLWQVARRPRWLAALAVAFGVAAGFAALGQWQIARSFEGLGAPAVPTETVIPLAEVAVPQQPITAAAAGQLVSAEVRWASSDYVILSDRRNTAATLPGYWVVARGITADGASVAVALGWAPTEDAAASVIDSLTRTGSNPAPAVELTGRYLPSESPQQSDFERGRRSALAVADLVNIWSVAPNGVYGGYIVAAIAPAGLQLIDSPPPITEVSLNLLNVFYAIEWVVFAGFALFLWYRLVRDTWEEEMAEPDRPQAGAAAGGATN